MFLSGFQIFAQEDSSAVEDEFDFSAYELAAPPAKYFCNNKVLGQTPTSLIGVFYTQQLGHDFTAGSPDGIDVDEKVRINSAQQFSFTGNFPIVSRNNILINLTPLYRRQSYSVSGNDGHPLNEILANHTLHRAVLRLTVFKPLNEKNFLLGRVGTEFNGNYSFDRLQPTNMTRFTGSLLYGWKPNDRLMYAFGLSRTYLGGALNYVPIAYYYHTFKNEKWGIEALLPARGALRYRFNSTSLINLGFQVLGGTFHLNDWNDDDPGAGSQALLANDVELRRSEIRAGLNYQRQLSGFIWFSVEAGYRINYSFDLDEGDFIRFFGSDEPYFIENDLANPLYFSLGFSYVSP